MARVLEYPYAKAEELAKMIPVVRGKPRSIAWMIENHSEFGRFYKNDPEAKEVLDLALKNEGLNKTFGVHAAGVIIANQAVDQIIPISKSNDGSIITQFSMDECASMGLLKMDFLGLRNLTMINNAIDIIEKSNLSKARIDIDAVPLDDAKTYDTVCSGNLAGIFQLETSSGMKQVARDLAPRNIEDISALIALYRPGPLDTGMIDDFIDCKSGKKAIVYDHPLLEPILKNTYGTIVYQEQIMQIAQVLAGFSLGEADLLRRAMGKKKPEVLLPFKDKFVDGCKANKDNVSVELAEKLFEQMLAFAEYCFNKSHSTAYGFVTYQTAYLKTHYPVEYLTALFQSAKGDTDRIKFYLLEAERLGIEVMPPNINLSDYDFSCKEGKIIFGMSAVKNVGGGPTLSIIEARQAGAFKDFFDFCSRLDHKSVNRKTIESLIKCGAMDCFDSGRKAMIDNLESFINSAKRSKQEADKGQVSLFSAAADPDEFQTSPNYIAGKDDEYPERELQSMEYQLLGLFVSNHPMQSILSLVKTITSCDIRALENKPDSSKVTIAALITDFTKKLTKAKKNICILQLEDMAARIEGVVFSRQLNDCEHMIEKGKRVLIKGTLAKHSEGDMSLMVESIEDIDELGTLEFDLDVERLDDYFQFFHQLKALITKPEHSGKKIPVLNLKTEAQIRKLALGSRFTIADNEFTAGAINQLIGESKTHHIDTLNQI